MSINLYQEMKAKHQDEVNAFPMAFAFSDKQLVDGLAKLGLGANDTDKVCGIPAGGFIRRDDAPRFKEMFDRHDRERKEAIAADSTGEEFIYQMFLYELDNHEYGYTGDPESALEALCISPEEIENCPRLNHGYFKACGEIRNREVE